MIDKKIVEQNAKDIGAQATIKQNMASDPNHNVWVGASAGTGKTKVLTDRVLRLLLPTENGRDGTHPESILCITFTKAGASEMVTRVMDVLSKWAVCNEDKLYDTLRDLLGHPPTPKQIQSARQLFATIIDLPNGLNITTIHAFCQSLLGRFTLEANLPPNFNVMDDTESQSILGRVQNSLLDDMIEGRLDKNLANAVSVLSLYKNADQWNSLLKSIVQNRGRIRAFIEGYQSVDTASNSIFDGLDIDKDLNEHDVFLNFFDDIHFPKDKILQLAKAFEFGAKTNQKQSPFLYDFCSRGVEERKSFVEEYKFVFLTKENTERVLTSAVAIGARTQDPQVDDIFIDEQARLLKFSDSLKNIKTANATSNLLYIANEVLRRYDCAKRDTGKLDYDDLIVKTHSLLKGDMNQWVLHKLDNQINHILVDEAQDTSPDQWSIILCLIDDFYSGFSAKDENDINRTIFVVGDIKQSIFSFQGANPKMFAEVKRDIQNRVENAQKSWQTIPMNTSFRSTQAVLSLVDKVFEKDDMAHTLTLGGEDYLPHNAFRQGQSGRVEIWPLFKAPNSGDSDPWTLPLSPVKSYNARTALAEKIAIQIRQWMDEKTVLKSTGKIITPGDIMILVRSRNSLVDCLIRALKSKDIPVSGADRLKVGTHIAVLDILSVIDFACMPDDDLSLACVLKSPLVGLCDDEIENIAYGRDGTLWNAFKKSSYSNIVAWLKNIIQTIPSLNAFESVSTILTAKTPCHDMNGWNAMMARLGKDCFDPLDELVSMAQMFDQNNAGAGVLDFVNTMRTTTSEIKRELDNGDGVVRIMTAHASKGLQAPIIFLPDTTSLPQPSGKSDEGFLWNDNDVPMWAMASADQNQLIKDIKSAKDEYAYQEYNRLLYVAMTRAEDRLIVCGALGKNGSTKSCEKTWYASVSSALHDMGYDGDWDGDSDYLASNVEQSVYKIYETDDILQKDVKGKNNVSQEDIEMPSWAFEIIEKDQFPPRVLSPSKMDGDMTPVRSPLYQMDDSYRFKRGLLTHSLLQYLPDIDVQNRAGAGRAFLKRQAPDVSTDIQESIIAETCAILNDPDFEMFFAKGSMAEIPVTGTVTHDDGRIDIISGIIDRLLVTDDTVWIVDFKSNRPPPNDPDKVPGEYRNQLKSYKILVQEIYPDHDVRCGLLWTDGPFMSELHDL